MHKLVPEAPGVSFLPRAATSKLMLHREKRILMLVSVGQLYHEGSFLDASVDLLVQQISLCREIVVNEALWKDRGVDVELAKGRWLIQVMCADSLQIRNFIEQYYRTALLAEAGALDDNTENEELRQGVILSLLGDWCELGSRYQEKATNAYERCRKAGQHVAEDGTGMRQIIEVDIQVITGHELFSETLEIGTLIEAAGQEINHSTVTRYQFWDAFHCLRFAYEDNIDALMQLANSKDEAFRKKLRTTCRQVYNAVNAKGYGHMTRDQARLEAFRKLLRPKELGQYFPKGELDTSCKLPIHSRDYILVEFAYLAHCLALGCGFPADLNRHCPTYIMYPHLSSFPALREIQNLFDLIFGDTRVCEVDYLGFGVSNDLKGSFAQYCIGVSQAGSDQFEKLQLENKGFIIDELRGADRPIIKKTIKRDEFNLPLADETYVPRPLVRKALEAIFAAPPTKDTNTRHAALGCLQGMGGMGKTQSALDYCYNPLHDYNLVIWINASGKKIDALYHQLAMDLFLYERGQSVEESVRKVREYLIKHPGWLLVLDDIDDDVLRHELSVEQSSGGGPSFFKGKLNQKIFSSVIPDSGGHVLITSRLEGWKGDGVINVDIMDLEGAIELLKKRLGDRFSLADVALGRLATILHRYPLALSHAAAWILVSFDETKQSPDEAINQYIAEYEKTPSKILDVKEMQGGVKLDPAHIHDSAVRTLKMLIERIQPRSEKDVTLARELLSVMAFINGDSIPCDLISEWTRKVRPNKENALPQAVEKLRQVFLITPRDEDNYKMHKVVQDIFMEWMVENDKKKGKEHHEMWVDGGWYENLIQSLCSFKENTDKQIMAVQKKKNVLSTFQSFLKNYNCRKMALDSDDYFTFTRLFAMVGVEAMGLSKYHLFSVLYSLYVEEIRVSNIQTPSSQKVIHSVVSGAVALYLCQHDDFTRRQVLDPSMSEADNYSARLQKTLGLVDKNDFKQAFSLSVILLQSACENMIANPNYIRSGLNILNTVQIIFTCWQTNSIVNPEDILMSSIHFSKITNTPFFAINALIQGYCSGMTLMPIVSKVQLLKALSLLNIHFRFMDKLNVGTPIEKVHLYGIQCVFYARLGEFRQAELCVEKIDKLSKENPSQQNLKILLGNCVQSIHVIRNKIANFQTIDTGESNENVVLFEKNIRLAYDLQVDVGDAINMESLRPIIIKLRECSEKLSKVFPCKDANYIEIFNVKFTLELLQKINDRTVNDYFMEILSARYGRKLYNAEGITEALFHIFTKEFDFVTTSLLLYLRNYYFPNDYEDDLIRIFHHLLLLIKSTGGADHSDLYHVERFLMMGIDLTAECNGKNPFDLADGDEQLMTILLEYQMKKAENDASNQVSVDHRSAEKSGCILC